MLRHPNAAPLLVQYFPRRFTLSTYERGALLLQRAGVPVELHAMILEGLDDLAFALSARSAARRTGGQTELYPDLDPARQPNLHRAAEAKAGTDEELFREAVRSFLKGVLSAPAKRAAKRS